MEKTRKILLGAFMLTLMMLFSSADLSAQTFKNGSDAQTALVAEYTAMKSATTSPDFEMNVAGLDMMMDALTANPNSTPAEVEGWLRTVVVMESEDYTPITNNDYDSGNYGSTEITDLQSYLFSIVTD